jgi:selenoprotein W-related protein
LNHISDVLGIPSDSIKIGKTLVPDTGGIFEVRVGDKVVAKRSMGHFPDEIEIVKAVAAAEKAAPTA